MRPRGRGTVALLPSPWVFKDSRIRAQTGARNRWRVLRARARVLKLENRRTRQVIEVPLSAVHSVEPSGLGLRLKVQVVLEEKGYFLSPLPANYWSNASGVGRDPAA